MSKPLHDVTVLDLGQAVAGPCVGWLLASLGARVIKLEGPNGGDLTRWMVRSKGGMSPLFAFFNGGKEGITLNLKTEKGRELLKALVRHVDVLVENFVPGTMEGWGLSYEALSAENPRLIHASVTGFGPTSRHAHTPAVDMVIQAMSGVMSATGPADGPPMMAGVLFMDTLASPHVAMGVIAALYERQTTGRGQRIEVAMRDVAVTVPFNIYNAFYTSGRVPQRMGNALEGFAPANLYSATDGYVYISSNSDKHAFTVFEQMGQPDLCHDERFRTQSARWASRAEIDRLVEAWTSGLPRQVIYERLAGAGVPCGMVLDIPEILQDADLDERGVFVQVEQPGFGPLRLFSAPTLFNGERSDVRSSPLYGQDNERVYNEFLAIDSEELSQFREEGIVP